LYAHTQIQVIARLAEYGPHRWSGSLLQFMITCTWAYMCLSCHRTQKLRADTAIYIHCSENRITLLSCSDGSYSTGPCQAVQAYLALATVHSPLPHPGSMPAAHQPSSHNAESLTNDTERELILAERPSNRDGGICLTAVLHESIVLCMNVA